jgi:hypothetical protein
MSKVNLSQLLSKKSFTVLCILLRNRCRVNTTALANTRANAFALLDTECAKKMSKFLNTLIETLEKPVLVKGYNRHIRRLIMLILQTHLQINRQQQYNVLFLVTDLGYYNVILSHKWLTCLDL